MAKINIITGKAYWCKLLEEPVEGLQDGRDWSVEVSVNLGNKASLEQLGLGPKIKNKGGDRGDYIQFRRREFKKKTGEPNSMVRVINNLGDEWPSDVLIGNGSDVEVKFNTYVSPGYRGNPPTTQAAILEMKVLNHVPFVKLPPPEKKYPPKPVESKEESWDVV